MELTIILAACNIYKYILRPRDLIQTDTLTFVKAKIISR